MQKFCRYTRYFWGIVVFCISTSFHQPKPIDLAGQRIIIKFKEQVNATNRNETPLTQLHLQKRAVIENLQLEVWQLPDEETISRNTAFEEISDYIDYLVALPEVEYAEPDYLVTTTETIPNDPAFHQQWALKNTGQNGCIVNNSIRATSAWDIQMKCDSLPIGIIDTGIDWTHPDLIENIWQNLGEDADGDSVTIEWDGTQWVLDPGDLLEQNDDDSNGYVNDLIGWDFVNDDNNPMDDDGHGTHVAGIIGARGNNGIGISGVCWEAKLMALKGLNRQGTGYVSELIQAIDYSVKMGVKISNNSWSLAGQYSQALYEAIERAQETDQLFVTAAGNNGTDNDIYPVYPASFQLSNIFAVGAADCQNGLPAFANYGEKSVDIMAPGDGIYSTQLNEEYGFRSGSSMAAPFVTGAAALMANKYPYVNYQQLKGEILQRSRVVNNFSDKCLSQGFINLHSLITSGPNLNQESESFVGLNYVSDTKDILESGDFIWILNQRNKRLVRINKQTNETFHYNDTNSPFKNKAKTISRDNQGLIYVEDQFDLWKLENNSWTKIGVIDTSIFERTSPIISKLLIDQLNNLWVGTYGGEIGKYSNGEWSHFSLSSNSVDDLIEDKTGNIWILQWDRLVKIDLMGNMYQYDITEIGLPGSRLSSITIDALNNIWVLGSSKLVMFDGLSWERILHSGLDTCNIWAPTPDPNEGIWLICGDSIGVLTGHQYYNYASAARMRELVPNDIRREGPFGINKLLIDHERNIWGGTLGGIVKFDGSDYKYIPATNQFYTIPMPEMAAISIDALNRVWIGSFYGIYLLKNGSWVYTGKDMQTSSIESINSIKKDSYGNMWGISDEYILKSEGAEWTFVSDSLPELFSNGSILAIDEAGIIWIKNEEGLLKFINSNSWIQFNTSNFNITPSSINVLALGKNGVNWLGTDQGLVQIEGETWTIHSTTNSILPADEILDVVIDANDVPILATNEGLVYFDRNNEIIYNTSNGGFSSNSINNLGIDKKGNIWFTSATEELVKFDRQSWTIYDAENLNLSSAFFQFAIDTLDNLWVSSGAGDLIYLNTKAKASFGITQANACLNIPFNFTNTSDVGNVIEYEWLINGNVVSNDYELSYTFTEPGIYEIGLILKDTLLGNRTFSQFITAQAPVSVNLGSDTTACAERIYLDVGIANSLYLWQDINGNTLSEDQGLIIGSSGIYTAAVTDACGFTAYDTITVNLTEDPLGSCVWPGDVNADGWVNLIDFLVLGAENGLAGTGRPDSSLEFTSQPSEDWDIEMNHAAAYGIDAKHADCNGDGRIDILTDAAAVFANAQGSHQANANSASAQNRLRIRPQQTRYNLGDVISYNVYLDNAQSGIVPEAYGLAFSMQHNLQLSQFPELDTEGSWLGTSREDMTEGIIKYSYHFDVGLTLYSKRPKSDSGKIAKVSLTILAEDIDTSKYVNKIFFTMKSLNALLMQQSGDELSINSLTTNTMETVTLDIPHIDLDLSVWLQGAYRENEQLMSTALRRQNLLPKEHPYDKIYQPKPDSIPPNVVDWIVVELRYPEDTSKVVSQRAAWLLDDGRIVDPEDGGPLSMVGTTGFYFISIKHRNHLSIMSANTLLLAAGRLTRYDFSHQEHATFGTNSMIQLSNGKWAMYAGDINQDKQIAYSGYGNDRAKILSRIGVANPTAVIRGYWPEDLNLDGLVKYSGSKNDRQLMLRNIGIEDLTRKIISHVP